MTDELVQLDLTLSVTDVPQANNLALFVRLVDALSDGVRQPDELAMQLEVELRTVHYYLDFGRWLKLIRPQSAADVEFTETGLAFASSVPARGRIFAQAMFAQKLIKTVQMLKRDSVDDDDLQTIDTRTACVRAIRAMTDLSESTVERRASGIATMLAAAYKPSTIDWSTGQAQEVGNRGLEFDGRSFTTALGARKFGVRRELRVGFPRQVRNFVDGKGRGVSAKIWNRASWSTASGDAEWFGSVPVNKSTVGAAERGGRDLRRLLVQVAPYISLSVAILTRMDRRGLPMASLTYDMYGARVWAHDRELGTLTEVVEQLAEALTLVPTRALPGAVLSASEDAMQPGTNDDLVHVLLGAGFLVAADTKLALARGVESELRESGDDAASLADMLAPAWDAFDTLVRG